MHIADATSIGDHIRRESQEDCYQAKEIPLPGELSESLIFVNNSDPRAISQRMDLQAGRAGNLAEDLTETQMMWAPEPPIASPPKRGNSRRYSP